MLARYECHYKSHRPHRARDRQPPPPVMAPAGLGQIRLNRHDVADGLISEYKNAAQETSGTNPRAEPRDWVYAHHTIIMSDG